ncbi:hypothetical protein BDV11DRAFT_181612 [Aspergillus similis]
MTPSSSLRNLKQWRRAELSHVFLCIGFQLGSVSVEHIWQLNSRKQPYTGTTASQAGWIEGRRWVPAVSRRTSAHPQAEAA